VSRLVAELPAPTGTMPAGTGRRRRSRQERLAYTILLPALGTVFVIVTIPFVLAIWQSITADDGTLVGFRNYTRALSNPLFYDALRATGLYSLIALLSWPILRVAFRYRARGTENLPREGGYVLAHVDLDYHAEVRKDHGTVEIVVRLERVGNSSLILHHEKRAEVKGLDAFGPDRPPVAPVFFAFRVMVGIGVLMLALSWFGAWATRRGRTAPPWLLWAFAACTFIGWIATLAGWLVTEIGRQPWLVTGILRTAQAVGEASGAELGASFTGYVLTYALLLIAYLVVLTHMAGKGATPKEA